MKGRKSKRSSSVVVMEDQGDEDEMQVYDLVEQQSAKKPRLESDHASASNAESTATPSTSKAPPTPILRRSRRTAKVVQIEDASPSASSAFLTPPSTMKKRGRGAARRNLLEVQKTANVKVWDPSILDEMPPPPPKPKPTLVSLPFLVQAKLLQYLDVDSVDNLSKTCSHFDLLINGNYLPSISIPFDDAFLLEVQGTGAIDKKPLLKLCAKKDSGKDFDLIFESQQSTIDYIIRSQLPVLQTSYLREIDLVSAKHLYIGAPFGIYSNGQRNKVIDSYKQFDQALLSQLSQSNSLQHVAKLNVMTDQSFFVEEFLQFLPNLHELGVTLVSRSLSAHMVVTEYVGRLENFVLKAKVKVLKLDVWAEAKKPIQKVLKNRHIEKLVIKGPCTFSAFPVMENLKEIEVHMDPVGENGNCCSYFKSRDDKKLHRHGLCVVNVGAVYDHCPKLEKFMGHDLLALKNQAISAKKSTKSKPAVTYAAWNSRLKKEFFLEYLDLGGTLDFKAWSKSRWIKKRPKLPTEHGNQRIANNLQAFLFIGGFAGLFH